uniref:Uncharacterized protein n=1 Tax=Anopheles christyi TaxID=43041 RepID=A0A182KIP3_9DIPT
MFTVVCWFPTADDAGRAVVVFEEFLLDLFLLFLPLLPRLLLPLLLLLLLLLLVPEL